MDGVRGCSTTGNQGPGFESIIALKGSLIGFVKCSTSLGRGVYGHTTTAMHNNEYVEEGSRLHPSGSGRVDMLTSPVAAARAAVATEA